MSGRINAIFEQHKAQQCIVLMPFVTGGYPQPDSLPALLRAIDDAGADIIEIGFPFSDPIADGPVIAQSMHVALEHGVTPDLLLDQVAAVRDSIEAGLIAMVSDSIVQRIGPNCFVRRSEAAGFNGLIIPDLDVEDADPIRAEAESRGMSFSLLIAPTSRPERIERLTKLCRGFVYLLARTGLTGEQTSAPRIEKQVALVRQFTDLPIAVGFGIATAEHVAAVAAHAEAAIVGSALVRRIGQADEPAGAAAEFVAALSSACARRASVEPQ